jgi:poly-gamma-glutamate synthesis protein (capsule biosynthesis protein)
VPTGRSRIARLLGTLLPVVLLAAGCSGQRPRLAAQVVTVPTMSQTRTPGGATPPTPRSFTVVATGEMLIHPQLSAQAAADARPPGAGRYDFRAMLAGIKPLVSGADLAICHLQTPLAPAGGPYLYYPAFSVPPQLAGAIAATGYDTCGTASNHTLDGGAAGVGRTLDALDEAGVRHTGSARSAVEAVTPDILDVHGVRVAQLAYTSGFNGRALPADRPWLANRTDPAEILAAARRARAAGAQVVIVSLQWGSTLGHQPDAAQATLAGQLLADPAVDLIVGCHTYLTQPFEKVNGKWVVYGLGNLLARHAVPTIANTAGMAARFTFTRDGAGRWRVTKAEYVPTYIDLGPPVRVVDLPAALADPALPAATRARYAQVQAATDQVATSLRGPGGGLTRGTR